IQQRLHATVVRIPAETDITKLGLNTVAQLKRLDLKSSAASELRTIEFSILALRQGFEVDIGPSKASPYLESRAAGVAANIADLIRKRSANPLLVIYGDDHVSRTIRKDGGPDRNEPLAPVALRLQRSGLKTFSLITLPLSGRYRWRGQETDLLWSAQD